MPDTPAPGKTTIAPEVLLSVARLTALDTEGVAYLSARTASVNKFLHRRHAYTHSGVQVTLDGDKVSVDIYVVLKSDVNIRKTSRDLQNSVARAITEMVGMDVGQVNIHIEDIDTV